MNKLLLILSFMLLISFIEKPLLITQDKTKEYKDNVITSLSNHHVIDDSDNIFDNDTTYIFIK